MPTVPTRDRRQFLKPGLQPAPVEVDQPDVVAPELPAPLEAVESAPITAPYARPVAAPAPVQELGTTGGVVPQQAGTWDVAPAPGQRLSDDPATREAQSVQQIQTDFEAQQRAKNPHLFSGAIPNITNKVSRRFKDRAINEGERAYADQVQADRAQIIGQRRDEQAAIKAENAQREAQFRSTGQQFYTDPYGRIQPIKDPSGRTMYHATTWEEGVHPKTGEPVLQKRDQFGQRQFKTPPIVASPDLTDDQLYYKFGDDDLRPAGKVEDLVNHPDFTIARTAKRAAASRKQAIWKEAIGPMEAVKADTEVAYDQAQQRAIELQAQIEQISQQAASITPEMMGATSGGFLGIGSTPTPAAAQAQQQKAALDAQLGSLLTEQQTLSEALKPMGQIGRAKRTASLDLAIFKAKAAHESYADLADERRMILRQQGKSEEDDPTLKSILEAQATYGTQIQRAASLSEREALAASQQSRSEPETVAPVAAPVAEPGMSAGETVKQTGKSLARGATSEGIYSVGEGLARMIDQFGSGPTGKAAFAAVGLGGVPEGAKWYADATRTLREQIRRALPVDAKFAQSKTGQIAQGVGQLAGTLPMALIPGGIAASSIGQIYDEGYQDALQNGATPEQAHSAALTYLPAASLDYLSDKLIVGKILKPLVGKMTVGQILKDIVVTGTTEGVTEGAQQTYLNAVASKLAGYHPNRRMDQEVLNSILVGAVVGGGTTGVAQTAKRVTGGNSTPPADLPPNAPTPDEGPVADFNRKLDGIPGGPKSVAEMSPEEAEAELQRRLEASDLSPEEKAHFEQLRAEGEPMDVINSQQVGLTRAPRSAEDVGGIFERNDPQVLDPSAPTKSAAEAAQTLEAVRATEYAPGEARPSSAEEAARVFEGEVPQTRENPPINPADESAAVILEGQARQQAAQAARQIPPEASERAGPAAAIGQSPEELARREAQGLNEPPVESTSNERPATPAAPEPAVATAEVPRGVSPETRTDVPSGEEAGTEAVGRPPVVPQSPEATARDRKEYDMLQRRMSTLLRSGGAEAVGSPAYQTAWQKSEDIKNRHGGMPPGEVAGEAQAGSDLRKAVDDFDAGGQVTVPDFADAIEGMGDDAPKWLSDAAEKYRREAKQDLEEFGGRGDAGSYTDALERAARRYLAKEGPQPTAKPKPAKNIKEPAVDTSPISKAATEQESVTIGGKMMREAKSRENMAAIQKAMQQWTPTATPAVAGETAQGETSPAKAEPSLPDLAEIRRRQPRPVEKLYGPNPTPEQRASQEAKIREWRKEYTKATKLHRQMVEESNERIRSERETITPANDTPVGKNDAGEQLYERADGSRYRMRNDREDRPNGYPDFGGDLSPVETKPPQTAPTPISAAVLSEKEAQGVKIVGRDWDQIKAMQQGRSADRPLPPVDAAKMKATIEREAAKFKNNQSADMVDRVGAVLPEGYVREGDSYVFKPEAPPHVAPAPVSESAAPSTPASVEGDKLNKNWTAFDKDSGTLGIPRAEMPQVKSEARGALVNFLKARGIDAKAGMINPNKLKPTQAEFSPAKVQSAREHTGPERPILISSDNHVVDGHHQWVAALDDTSTPMPVIRLNAPIDRVLAEMKEFPSSEAAQGAQPKAAERAPVIAAPATRKLSDRAIEALQKAKINKPGQITSQTPLTLAYDAALDIAILAIRAGRAVGDVTKLAIARFKAKHPAATDADVAKLTKAIQDAHANPPPPAAPRASKSKVPESLRKGDVPAADITYDVRNQDERMKEARGRVEADAAKAESDISNRNIAADTRVALGGVLLEKKMAELANAKPADIPRITQEINRITAAVRSGVSTESGQGVAMHNRIYQNLGVMSAMEYTRETTKKRVEALGGEDAEKAAAEAAEIINKTKDQTARDKAIEKLKERYTSKPVKKMLNSLQGLEVAQKLNELGVLRRDDLIDVAANELGLPGVEGTKLRKIADLVDRIEGAPNLAEAESAQLELADTLANFKGTGKVDLETSLMTLNVLLSANTQIANAGGNAFRLMTELASSAAVNPKQTDALWTGFKGGLPLGWAQAKSIWETGRSTRDLQDKTIGVGSAVERADYKELYPGLNKTALGRGVAAALNGRKEVLARVGRFMRAMDALAYYPAREAYARMAVTKMLEGQHEGDALEKKVSEILHTTPAEIQSAKKQAESEGYKGVAVARRASEIIEARRGLTPEGETAAKQAEEFGAETTFTNEPVGNAGIIYRGASNIANKVRLGGVPVLKPWMMFLRTPTNMFNAALDYTPVGAVRAMKGSIVDQNGQPKNFTQDEINRKYFQASVGTALMAGATMAIAKGLMDVTFKGPDDPEKKRQLLASGWRPFSVRIGNGPYISYRETPMIVPLAVVGYVADAAKYNKDRKSQFLESRVADALLNAPYEAAFATSPLTGMADLLGAANGKGNLARGLTSVPANLAIPGARLLMELDRYLDPKVYDSNPLQQTVPFLRRHGTVRSDVQGRPVETRPSDRFIGLPSNDSVDKFISEKKVFVPGISETLKVGKGPLQRDMTAEEQEAYKRVSGQRIRARLQAMLPRLRSLDQEDAQKEIDSISREERARVKPLIGTTIKK